MSWNVKSYLKDPANRPRVIIWTGVIVLILASFVVVALGVTSTRWFCAEGCHKVQDDTITAYEHSTHAKISCMACHMPVNADPITFVLHKMEALLELYLTVTDKFELPLNPESEVGLTMKSENCTQCHNLKHREVTPSEGILIDHKAHSEQDVNCTICHNRIAHVEDFELVNKDPETGKNRKHEDFMEMTACFRCHSQGESEGLAAPGNCSACHPKGFDLKPESHDAKDFYPKGHAKLAAAEVERITELESESGEASESTHDEEGVGPSLPEVAEINVCYTCHSQKFCSDCHGIDMPHPTDFKEGHGDLGKKDPKVCATCHGSVDEFCNECHHGTSMDYVYDNSMAWRKQHPKAVSTVGAGTCFECHDPTYCAHCHVSGKSE